HIVDDEQARFVAEQLRKANRTVRGGEGIVHHRLRARPNAAARGSCRGGRRSAADIVSVARTCPGIASQISFLRRLAAIKPCARFSFCTAPGGPGAPGFWVFPPAGRRAGEFAPASTCCNG